MARVLHNPLAGSVGPEWGPSSGSSGAAEFHRRLPGYRATPLVPAPLLAARFGVGNVLVKDESNRYGLPAFKMLGASWAAYCLLVERLGRSPVWRTIDDLAAAFAPLRPLELVTATDGNHGRAVARVARLFGLGARVFVAEGTAP
ncbi:MAG TPA: pyridoxal-phosphate dependent enzyme, partial [Acidimicrobiales bacterium]|nr:pyridoxal-phosphate dependent enzyme [Acidimicrobiales bacterium]